MENSWIKLNRSILNHWIFDNPDYLRAWLIILIKVNFKDSKSFIDGELIDCKRGEAIFSVKSWADSFGKGWSVQRVRTFFKHLENDKMIAIHGLRKTTKISVCNYETYQGEQRTDNAQITHSQRTDNDKRRMEEGKEGKNRVFVRPTLQEICTYMTERGCPSPRIESEKFFDYYTSNGWKVGKNSMKYWKATVRNWLKGSNFKGNKPAVSMMSAAVKAEGQGGLFQNVEVNR